MRKFIMFIMSEFLALISYVLFIYFLLFHDFAPGGGRYSPWCFLLLLCSIVLSARAILSLDKIKMRTKIVCMCLNLFVGIIIFLIGFDISVKTLGDWGSISQAG